MTPDEIAKLRALAGAATPWPWFVGRMPDDPRPVVMAGRGRVIVFDTAEGDTIYIAAACNAVPRLCDDVERLRAAVERLTRELREARRVAAEIYHFIDADRDAKAMKRAGDLTRHIDSVLGAPAIRAAEGET